MSVDHLPLEHAPGCPAEPNRLETYTATRPGDPRRGQSPWADAHTVTVTRCRECGREAVDPPPGGKLPPQPQVEFLPVEASQVPEHRREQANRRARDAARGR